MGVFQKIVLITLGGALGSNVRYWLGGWIAAYANSEFPWGTFAINVSGSLVIGAYLAASQRLGWPLEWKLLIAVGVLGGYTTFSTFSWETLELMSQGAWELSLAYAFGSLAASLLGCYVGITLARTLVGAG